MFSPFLCSTELTGHLLNCPVRVAGPHPECDRLYPLSFVVRSDTVCPRAMCDVPVPPLFPELLPWVM